MVLFGEKLSFCFPGWVYHPLASHFFFRIFFAFSPTFFVASFFPAHPPPPPPPTPKPQPCRYFGLFLIIVFLSAWFLCVRFVFPRSPAHAIGVPIVPGLRVVFFFQFWVFLLLRIFFLGSLDRVPSAHLFNLSLPRRLFPPFSMSYTHCELFFFPHFALLPLIRCCEFSSQLCALNVQLKDISRPGQVVSPAPCPPISPFALVSVGLRSFILQDPFCTVSLYNTPFWTHFATSVL